MMSGHNAMCVVTALLESGMVPMVDAPITSFCLEAPCGLIAVEAQCAAARVTSVSLRNQPAFCRERDMDVIVDVPTVGKVCAKYPRVGSIAPRLALFVGHLPFHIYIYIYILYIYMYMYMGRTRACSRPTDLPDTGGGRVHGPAARRACLVPRSGALCSLYSALCCRLCVCVEFVGRVCVVWWSAGACRWAREGEGVCGASCIYLSG